MICLIQNIYKKGHFANFFTYFILRVKKRPTPSNTSNTSKNQYIIYKSTVGRCWSVLVGVGRCWFAISAVGRVFWLNVLCLNAVGSVGRVGRKMCM